MNKAFFFDRDGIVNSRLVGEYVRSMDEFIFIEEVFELFAFVRSRGFLCIIISNQQGVGKGLMSESDLATLTENFQRVMEVRCGARFDAVYYSTELESDNSPRRKPAPGMFFEAEAEWNLDLHASWMIGDSPGDAVAGHRAGTRTILVGDFSAEGVPEADHITPDLRSALKIVQEML